MYRRCLAPLLFRLPAEQAHGLVLRLGGGLFRIIGPWGGVRRLLGGSDRGLSTDCFGLRFSNPVGLAAGMDKNGRYLWLWWALGFGFVEIGTITPRPQPGNPRPRLFRLPKQGSLINHMGFNNEGMQALGRRLRRRPPKLIIGINIGKQKETPLQAAAQDYLASFSYLHPWGDYFVLNISSPNTEGLQSLQEEAYLRKLLEPLMAFNQAAPHPKPLLLKISPDLSPKQLQHLFALCKEMGVAGLIATNTSKKRVGVPAAEAALQGGLSGALLRTRAAQILNHLAQQPNPLPLIGVGGIDSPETAAQRRAAGATLIQLYTGLVYEGPSLPRRIKKHISSLLHEKSRAC